MVNVEVTLAPGANGSVPEGLPAWAVALDNIQLTGAIVGVIANLMTMITLMKNGDDFSEIIRMLFKYQSALDCLICLQAALLFSLPPFWQAGNIPLDTILCQAWHSQCLYWLNVFLSVWNLVTLAIERYICVCHPLKYNLYTVSHFRRVVIILFIVSCVYLTPGLFQTRLIDGACVSQFFWDGATIAYLFWLYSISSFFLCYAIPCAFFFVMYGLVILSFKNRAKKNLGASGGASVIEKASTELTKTAIVVTVIFIISIGVDLWYYLLANTGLVPYVFNSPIQKIAVFFSVVNSVANPFVYASFMPSYRMSVKKTFFKSCSKK